MLDFYTVTQPDSDAGLLGAPIYTVESELLTSTLELGLVTHCLGPALSFPPREPCLSADTDYFHEVLFV